MPAFRSPPPSSATHPRLLSGRFRAIVDHYPLSRSAIALAVSLSACGMLSDARPLQHSDGETLDRVLSLGPDIQLYEDGDVVNVEPQVSVDPQGGYIVADSRENRVRLYSAQGQLRRQFGGKGSGPGEFRRLSSAVRMESGRIIALDTGGQLTVFDPSGMHVIETQRTSLVPAYGAAVLDADRLVLSGRLSGRAETPLVHIWNIRTRQLERSFYSAPTASPKLATAYAYTGFADIAVRSDSVAVLFALSDTVQVYTTDGVLRRSIRIPFSRFRRLAEPLPAQGSVATMQRWLESFSAAADLFWRTDGSFLVQYFDVSGVESKWRLLRMGSRGERHFELIDSPRALTLSANGSSVVLVTPRAQAPNVWSLASLER